MNISGEFLVIGNGTISKAIRQYIPHATALVRPDLDIRDEDYSLPTTDDGIAVICAAITGFSMCETYAEWSRVVNVDATYKTAIRLADHGWRVIMLSSSAAEHPTTEYGRQKADLEEKWNFGPILRLPKILHAEVPVIDNWIRLLKLGKPAPTHRTLIQPIGRQATVEAITVVGPQPINIYSVAGETVSWTTVAHGLAYQLGCSSLLVTPVDAPSATNAQLLDSFTMRYLGWTQPTIGQVIEEVIAEWTTF